MSYHQFLWLHIKKSGGGTTRKLLQPYYREVDRSRRPKNFVQASPDEYNDILNNYRVVLGEYQFRRALFAKKYLYPDSWPRIFSFAFSREPVDRAVSMFYYLYWRKGRWPVNLISGLWRQLKTGRPHHTTSYAFDAFLDCVEETRASESIYRPLGNHFSTHTAGMWEDITGLDGQVLLTRIFRLENLREGLNTAFEACGLDKTIERSEVRHRSSRHRGEYRPTRKQVRRIEEIYARDFELYESARM